MSGGGQLQRHEEEEGACKIRHCALLLGGRNAEASSRVRPLTLPHAFVFPERSYFQFYRVNISVK